MPTSAPRAIPYGDLSQRSEDYTKMSPVREAMDDFYAGGHVLASKVQKYIPRILGELPKRYADRVKAGAYINYFGQITDYYASALFTQELSVRQASDADDKTSPGEEPDDDDLYTQFSKNADDLGHTLNEVLHDLVITGLKQRSAWVHVEMPAPPEQVVSRAQEEALGLGIPYLFEVPHEQIIDCDYDDDGELTFIVLHQKKALKGPPGARKKNIRETFEVWRREGEVADNPVVSWARYAIEYDPNKPPQDTKDCLLEEEGETSFQRIPLLEMVLPDGLWLGNKLCGLAREHYQRRTTLNSAENRSMVAIPVVKLGPEIPSTGGPLSEVQENPNRGEDPVTTFVAKGYEVIGSGDSIEFVEPKGAAYEHVAKRLDNLKDEMHRVAHQMSASVSMHASTQRQSGASKKEDRLAESLVLAGIGRIVRNFAVRIYDTISGARKEDVVWVPHGLDTYELEDREQVLEESVSMQAVDIPSPTFRKEHAKRVYRKLVPNMPPATTAKIDDEIEDGVEDQQALRELEQEAQVDQLKNPPPPVVPQPAPPGTPKTPTAQPPAQAKPPKVSSKAA